MLCKLPTTLFAPKQRIIGISFDSRAKSCIDTHVCQLRKFLLGVFQKCQVYRLKKFFSHAMFQRFPLHACIILCFPHIGQFCWTEAEKPKTFRVATFYTQKLSGRSARNRFSQQAKKARFCLSRHCQRMRNEAPEGGWWLWSWTRRGKSWRRWPWTCGRSTFGKQN